MVEHWERRNSEPWDVLDDLDWEPGRDSLASRLADAAHTTLLAAAVSFLSASTSIWFVETFLR